MPRYDNDEWSRAYERDLEREPLRTLTRSASHYADGLERTALIASAALCAVDPVCDDLDCRGDYEREQQIEQARCEPC